MSIHCVLGTPIHPPFAQDMAQVLLGMGCFWGAERRFWQQPGVWTTAVGYAGGNTEQPDYPSVCSGQSGHAEVVLVVFDPRQISLQELLKVFWESHDPTQGMRQGNDIGSQYRSVIYCSSAEQLAEAQLSCEHYERALSAAQYPAITTEIALNRIFYYAEDYHQQYLAKNPNGYCGLRGTGVRF